MARLRRLVLPGHAHLVVQRALPGLTAFTDADDRQAWRQALQQGLTRFGVQLNAWSLQPGEVRMVLTPTEAPALGRLVQHLGRQYVAAYRRRHGGRGTLWDGRYRCAVLAPGTAVLDAMRWVEGVADSGAASSAAHHQGTAQDRLLTDPSAYWALGNTPFERESAWRRVLESGLPPSGAERLTKALRGGWAVGDADFATQAGAAGRPAAPRPRGRPRRTDTPPHSGPDASPGATGDPGNTVPGGT